MDEDKFYRKSKEGAEYNVLSVKYVWPYAYEPRVLPKHVRLTIVFEMGEREQQLTGFIPHRIVEADKWSYIKKIRLGWQVKTVLGLSPAHLAHLKEGIEGYKQFLKEEEEANGPPDHSLLFPKQPE